MLQYQPCPTEKRQGRRSGRKRGTTLALAAYPVCGFVDEPDEDVCGGPGTRTRFVPRRTIRLAKASPRRTFKRQRPCRMNCGRVAVVAERPIEASDVRGVFCPLGPSLRPPKPMTWNRVERRHARWPPHPLKQCRTLRYRIKRVAGINVCPAGGALDAFPIGGGPFYPYWV